MPKWDLTYWFNSSSTRPICPQSLGGLKEIYHSSRGVQRVLMEAALEWGILIAARLFDFIVKRILYRRKSLNLSGGQNFSSNKHLNNLWRMCVRARARARVCYENQFSARSSQKLLRSIIQLGLQPANNGWSCFVVASSRPFPKQFRLPWFSALTMRGFPCPPAVHVLFQCGFLSWNLGLVVVGEQMSPWNCCFVFAVGLPTSDSAPRHETLLSI